MKPNFIIAVTGQSNSQGYGGFYDPSKTEDQPHERVMGWNNNLKSWDIAALYDESLGTTEHKILGSQLFAFHFAKQIAKNDPSKIVGIINYGIGGQEIKRWNKIPGECFFTFCSNQWDDTTFSLKACNDKVLCIDNNNKLHFTRPININFGWESFNLIDSNSNEILDPLTNIKSYDKKTVYIKNKFYNNFIDISNGNIILSNTPNSYFEINNLLYNNSVITAFKLCNTPNFYLGLANPYYISGDLFGYSIEGSSLTIINSVNHNDIFTKHTSMITEALKDANLVNIDCLCWHQGEADFNKFGTYYENCLYQTILQYRNMHFCNYNTPIIVGNTTIILQNDDDWWKNNNKQLFKLNLDNFKYTACVDTIGVDYNLNDPIHFSSEGHRQLGFLYCEKYIEMKI